MRFAKSTKKEKKVENTFTKEVLETISDYQSYKMSLEDAIRHTAQLFKIEESEVKAMIPEGSKSESDTKPTMESIMKKLTDKEKEILESKLNPVKPKPVKKEAKNVFTVEEEFVIPGTEIVLEKGDRYQVIPKREQDEEPEEDEDKEPEEKSKKE